MGSKSMREERNARRNKQKTMRTFLWIGIGIFVAIIIGFVAWNIFKPAAGESVPIMANAGDHVPPGSDPGPFNSNPPTSGQHYGQEFDAGFYEESDPEVQNEFPEGYLIMNEFNNFKVIGFPYNSIDVPLAMTSWGRMLAFDTFNPDAASDFIRSNRNRAPEPNAP
jgi:hypothetical protein